MGELPRPGLSTPVAKPIIERWWSRPWVGVLSRTLAAGIGGYALAVAGSALLAVALPIQRGQAVLVGMLAGIVLCACAPLWAFAVDRPWKAWAGIAGPALAMGLAAMALMGQA